MRRVAQFSVSCCCCCYCYWTELFSEKKEIRLASKTHYFMSLTGRVFMLKEGVSTKLLLIMTTMQIIMSALFAKLAPKHVHAIVLAPQKGTHERANQPIKIPDFVLE